MKEAIITSSILIMCIVLLRQLCKRRISAKMQYMLWLVVAVRLIMPGITAVWPNLMPESGYSILNVTDKVERAALDYIQPQERTVTGSLPSEGLPFLTEETAEGNIVTYFIDRAMWQEILRKIWYLGMIVVGVWMAAVNVRFMHRLYKSRRRYEKEDFKLPVYTAEELSSPCLYGLPEKLAIYLPEDVIGDEERVRHILAHEYCHYKHKDVFWSVLRCVLLTVYWFHPLVWLAAVLSKQDCELACDEAAVRLLGEEERIAYGKTLVSLIIRKTRAADIVCAATTMTAGAESVKERIRRIVESPRKLAFIIVPVLMAVAVVVAFTFTKAKEYPEGTYLLEGENSLTVTTSCFQVTFPEDFAKKAYYRGANGTDIIVYHKDSNLEVGRFCMLFYEEAVQLVEEKEIILVGDYGSNGTLNNYMSQGTNESADHVYQGNEAGAAGVPGTDSSSETTYHYYYQDDSFSEDTAVGTSGGVGPIPAPEEVKADMIDLPFQGDENYNAVDVEDETTSIMEDELTEEEPHDYLPNEQISTGEEADYHLPAEEIIITEGNTVYLPNEQITEIYLPSEQPCYLYIPADYTGAEPEIRTELLEMNQSLIELTNSVVVLYVSQEAMEAALNTLVANRTAYVGDNVSVSHIVGALPAASGLSYQFLELGTTTEPYEATIHYRRQSDNRIDSDISFLDAVLIFATIENLEICNIQIQTYEEQITDGVSSDVQELPNEEISYKRSDMEKIFGTLYPCSETEEALTGLYNRVLEYLHGETISDEK